MFKALFNIIIGLLSTLIQVICYPINAVITGAMPDLSENITFVATNIPRYFQSIGYALSWLPSIFVNILMFIVSVEIAKYSIYFATHGVLKVWNLFQKIKFW